MSGTASGSGEDKVAAADGGDAGAKCAPHTCDDRYYGDNYAAICATTKLPGGVMVMLQCARVSGGGLDLVTADQGDDFMNGGPPNDPNARPRQVNCSGGPGRDTGTQCEFYRDVEVRLPTR